MNYNLYNQWQQYEILDLTFANSQNVISYDSQNQTNNTALYRINGLVFIMKMHCACPEAGNELFNKMYRNFIHKKLRTRLHDSNQQSTGITYNKWQFSLPIP